MFNYDRTDVATIRQVVQTQLMASQDNTSTLFNAVEVISGGAWKGEGAEAFLNDSARLRAEIEAVQNQLTAFISQLSQASGTTDEVINTLSQMIASLP